MVYAIRVTSPRQMPRHLLCPAVAQAGAAGAIGGSGATKIPKGMNAVGDGNLIAQVISELRSRGGFNCFVADCLEGDIQGSSQGEWINN